MQASEVKDSRVLKVFPDYEFMFQETHDRAEIVVRCWLRKKKGKNWYLCRHVTMSTHHPTVFREHKTSILLDVHKQFIKNAFLYLQLAQIAPGMVDTNGTPYWYKDADQRSEEDRLQDTFPYKRQEI